jgi:hypothetical protein
VHREPPHFFARRQVLDTHRFVRVSGKDVLAIGRHRD